jgi:hypothetical protein
MSQLAISPLTSWPKSNLFGKGFTETAAAFEENNPGLRIQPTVTLTLKAEPGSNMNYHQLNQQLEALGKQFDPKCRYAEDATYIAYA